MARSSHSENYVACKIMTVMGFSKVQSSCTCTLDRLHESFVRLFRSCDLGGYWMRTVIAVLLATTLAACATRSGPAAEDAFTQIARSWEGAPVEDMIRVWGNPRLLEQDEANGGAGSAMWAIFSKYEAQRTRCEATATFDAAGLIRNIDVVSVNCPPERAISWRENWDIDQLRRPGTK